MKIREIYEALDTLSPFCLQEDWDNSGLLIGSYEDEVEAIDICLDVDQEIIQEAPPKTLFITHHPLIFKGLKRVDSLFPSKLVKEIIKKDSYLISMHTNIDKTHLNRYVVEKVLGQKVISCEDFICYFDTKMSFDELVLLAKKSFNLLHTRVVAPKNELKRVALTTGSGGDLIEKVKADCFLTGDLKYHQAFGAMENGLGLIDIGHYESECFFGDVLELYLKKLQIKVIMSNSKNPFEYR